MARLVQPLPGLLQAGSWVRKASRLSRESVKLAQVTPSAARISRPLPPSNLPVEEEEGVRASRI